MNKLTALERRSVSRELVQEFEACLSSADKVYEDAEKSMIEREINRHIG